MWAPGVHEDDIPGVGHSDELFLQWDPWRGEQHTLNSEDSRLSLEVSTLYSALYSILYILYTVQVTTMWTNFVKFGHPTPAQADMGYTWEPVTAGDIRSWIVTI